MTDKQYMRMQHLMLKDEVQELTKAEHDEMFALIELAEAEADANDLFYQPTKGDELNDQSKTTPNPCLHCNA